MSPMRPSTSTMKITKAIRRPHAATRGSGLRRRFALIVSSLILTEGILENGTPWQVGLLWPVAGREGKKNDQEQGKNAKVANICAKFAVTL